MKKAQPVKAGLLVESDEATATSRDYRRRRRLTPIDNYPLHKIMAWFCREKDNEAPKEEKERRLKTNKLHFMIQTNTTMKTKTVNNRGSSELTRGQERELGEHAIRSYLMHMEREGVDPLSVMQPATGTTVVDQRQSKVILNNANGLLAEAVYSYKNGKFRCRWI
jgi:hypothetical protein